MSDEKWDQLLRDNGFTGTELTVGGADSLSSMIVSTASISSTSGDRDILEESQLLIIREAKSVLQSTLALSIQNAGMRLGIHTTIADVENSRESYGKVCILLWTIDLFSFENPTEQELKYLQTAFRSLQTVLWVTRRSDMEIDFLEQDGILGLSHAIISENEDMKLVTLGLENFEDISGTTQEVWRVLNQYFLKISRSAQSQLRNEQILQKDGRLCIRRVLPVKHLETEILEMMSDSPVYSSTSELGTPDDEVEIEIKARSIRAQDLAFLIRKLKPSLSTKVCAGVVTRLKGEAQKQLQVGARVVVLDCDNYNILEGCIRCAACQVREISEELTIESSIGLLFELMAAYEALSEWAHLQETHSIIIQDGPSALGHATIQLALAIGAEVFVTASRDEDVKNLSDTYNIPASHIYKSQNKRINGEIVRLTGGRGVDVLVLSGTGNDRRTILDCVAPRGKVIAMSPPENDNSNWLSTSACRYLKKNVSYVNIDISQIFRDRQRMSHLLTIVMGMMESKKLLDSSHLLERLEASEILRAPQSRKVNMPSGSKLIVSFDRGNPSSSNLFSATLTFPSDATYVIAGGLGGLGRSIIGWMVSCGARNFLLLSRKGAEGSDTTSFLEKMVALGAMIVAPKCDIGNENAVQEVLRETAQHIPRIRGCIQASMVLRVIQTQKTIYRKTRLTKLRSRRCSKPFRLINGTRHYDQKLPARSIFTNIYPPSSTFSSCFPPFAASLELLANQITPSAAHIRMHWPATAVP